MKSIENIPTNQNKGKKQTLQVAYRTYDRLHISIQPKLRWTKKRIHFLSVVSVRARRYCLQVNGS